MGFSGQALHTLDECLDRYKRGLKAAVRLDVERANPQSLQQAMSHALRADEILFRVQGTTRNLNITPAPRQLPRPAPRSGPTPMEVDNIYRERPAKVQCHRCKGFGHIAKNCAIRPRPGEHIPISQNITCHRVTDIESRSVRKGCKPVEYCGNMWGLPVATKKLPCYLGTMEGRVVRALVDSSATDNFVAKGLLKEDLHKD